MTQYYFAGRVYGDMCVRQPLTEAQAEKFVLQYDETDDLEIFYVMNGSFLVVTHEPGVLFIEDPNQSRGQLCVRLKGSDTFWSINVISHSDFIRMLGVLLRHSDTLATQIRACDPIGDHAAYRQKIFALMEMMAEKDVRNVVLRQIRFIKLERSYGTQEENVTLGAPT